MERNIYEIRVRGLKDREEQTTIGKKETKEAEKREAKSNVKSNAEVVKTDFSAGVKRTVGALASIYAASQLVAQPIMRDRVNMATITGDIAQARNLERMNNQVNKFVSLGFETAGIGVALMINPVFGGVALLGSGVKLAQESIQREQTNNMIRAQNSIRNFVNTYESNRMIRR